MQDTNLTKLIPPPTWETSGIHQGHWVSQVNQFFLIPNGEGLQVVYSALFNNIWDAKSALVDLPLLDHATNFYLLAETQGTFVSVNADQYTIDAHLQPGVNEILLGYTIPIPWETAFRDNFQVHTKQALPGMVLIYSPFVRSPWKDKATNREFWNIYPPRIVSVPSTLKLDITIPPQQIFGKNSQDSLAYQIIGVHTPVQIVWTGMPIQSIVLQSMTGIFFGVLIVLVIIKYLWGFRTPV
jgi:hypothetical protein